VLWVQVRHVPATVVGDAAGELDATDWDALKEAYADRVMAILEEYAPGVSGLVLGRHVLSPLDLERANPNLVGGDQLGGSHHPAQNFFLRPVPGWSRYRTPIEGLYMCGAATWPGAGVGAGSGYILGKLLARPRRLKVGRPRSYRS
jgi:phytoene dehydrogenase-like protein